MHHQDYPYWYVRIEEEARDVARDPTRFPADPARLDRSTEVVVEAPAGSVLFFGSLLVHRSAANRSERPRRALLPSYQPAGRIRWHETPLHLDLVDRLP